MSEGKRRGRAAVGDRVGALLSGSEHAVKLIGYGVRIEDQVPPPEAGGLNVGIEVPAIRLDSGDVVFGCECWWGRESTVRDRCERTPVVEQVPFGSWRASREEAYRRLLASALLSLGVDDDKAEEPSYLNQVPGMVLHMMHKLYAWEASPQALHDVHQERRRQQMREGYTAEHDDQHTGGQLAMAAVYYVTRGENVWPEGWAPPKPPGDLRADLVRATALLLAEIERLDRAGGAP